MTDSTDNNEQHTAESDGRCPGCGHSCCPHPGLECGGDSDAVRKCERVVSCDVCTTHYDPRAVIAGRHCSMCHASVTFPAKTERPGGVA